MNLFTKPNDIISEISGYLMSDLIKIKNDGVSSVFGAITNGQNKIPFNLYEIPNIPEIPIGTFIQLSGDFEKTGNIISIADKLLCMIDIFAMVHLHL